MQCRLEWEGSAVAIISIGDHSEKFRSIANVTPDTGVKSATWTLKPTNLCDLSHRYNFFKFYFNIIIKFLVINELLKIVQDFRQCQNGSFHVRMPIA